MEENDFNNLIDGLSYTISEILDSNIDMNLRHILMQLYHVCDNIKYTKDNSYLIALKDLVDQMATNE